MKAIIAGLVITLGLALALLVLWPIWALWCYVLPQVYPSGPVGFIQPGYWLFAAIWILAIIVKRSIFGTNEKAGK